MTLRAPPDSGRVPSREEAFKPGLLEKGRLLAGQYRIVLQPSSEKRDYLGWCLEMPGVMAEGSTPAKCLAETQEAIAEAIATLLETGQQPPAPYGQREVRTAQINIRVTPEEKLLLEEAGRQRGFNAVSDFVRTAALREAQNRQTAK
jgi:predicted RNase H-like HicB family nuclease